MSLATRCTHCGTIFKVVEDQLKVSEGWVRCGRCQQVFHALPTLFDLEREAPPPRSPAATAPAAGQAASQASLASTPPTPHTPQPPSPASPAPAPAPWPLDGQRDTAATASPQASAEAHADARGDGDADADPADEARDNPPSEPPSAWEVTRPLTSPGALDEAPAAGLSEPASEAALAATEAADAPVADAPVATPQPGTQTGPHIGPQPAPPQTRSWLAPVPATTDFDLDTAVPEADLPPSAPAETAQAETSDAAPSTPLTPGLDDIELDTDVPLTSAPAHPYTPEPSADTLGRAASPAPGASIPALADAPAADAASPSSWPTSGSFDLVPSTEESDALDSRYLLPSERRERPAARRPAHGQDFADAEVPDDWLLDAEDDLAASHAPSHTASPAAAEPALITVLSEPKPVHPDAATAHATDLATPRRDDDASAASPASAPDHTLGLPHGQAPATASGATAAPDDTPADITPGFVQRAQAQARWRHPAMRAMLGVLALLLLALLGGQVTHQFRDLIAAHHPPMRPLLAQWCELAGCTIRPPLRIEDLQVESLSFVRATSEGPDTYRLTVVLRNKAPIALAWPQLDLSLTDLNGAVLMRRAFDPKDASWQDSPEPQSGPGQQPPDAAPADRSTTLQWRMKIAKLQPAGYTADIFYP